MTFRRPPFQALILIVALIAPLAVSAQTPPDRFLGHQVGADRKLADYGQIKAYFEKLDAESPKLSLVTIGESVQKRPIIMAVITAEENMAKLDAYREIARKLKMARGLAADDARKLAREGKSILLITCSLHATEIAASQMSMEFAYDLVAGKTPFDAAAVLKDVIVLLVPTHNPDGNQMVVDWYRKYLGTKFEGGNMPWLYHVYAGHDNNRDWFMFNLPETKAVTKVLYHDWHPQIHIDEHQMGSNGARLFIPPFMDPPIPNVQPLLWRGVNLCGAAMPYDLQKNGKSGVVHGRSFTGWWIGACDDTSWLHNTIGILSEMASVRGATPIFIEPGEVQRDYVQKRMEFPDPWPGGWWRLRDLVEYELILSKSLVNTAALLKEDFLYNSYLMSKASIETVDKNQPYAFVVPARQHDSLTMLKMMDILLFGGVEIHRAQADFVADRKLYPAGSYVILMAQPFKPYAWALLDKQKYPDLREYPGGPPVTPYDNAGWTVPLQMGVACDRIENAFEAGLEKVAKIGYPVPADGQGQAAWFALDCRTNAAYPMAFALLKDKAEVYRTKAVITRKGVEVPAGCFLVKNSPEVKKALPGLASKYAMAVLDLDDVEGIDKAPVKFNRVGLYQSWKSNMDEGWTRYVFDDLGIPYVTIHNADFKAAKGKKLDLKANYDVIVFPDENADIIKTGKPDPSSPWARWMTPMPPDYEGGIEQAGVDALKAFVEAGGIVVALNGAGQFAIKELQVPARNGLERIERTRFFCPMSILKLEVDNTTPIGYGLSKTTPAVFSDSPGYETRVPPNEWDRKVVAAYPEEGVLMSGWLLGEDVIARKAAVVDYKHGKGRIILIGVVSQNRAQSHGTYKFLLNALLYPEL
ncbi:MAG: hypothetical protein JW742_01895 [Candidatus Aminicenantes bacterium]|nr:hypothetical protein [Candidatus Aminicenantes bacterium]